MTTETMLNPEKATVADIALAIPRSIEVLNRYGLDYCCGGKKPFTDACKKSGLNTEQVWNEIIQSNSEQGKEKPILFDTWDASLLIDFIVEHHHHYVRNAIPQISELLDKVCSVHGNENPELLKIRNDFDRLAEELLAHLPKEEQVLFPAIKRIEILAPSDATLLVSLRGPISMMEQEHDLAGELVKSIRELTLNYSPPAYACPTFKLTYVMLQEFDNDLIQHIHLENNILFPKVRA